MKKKLHSALRSRRGITIAETIIALAIVMMVSVAAISLMAAAVRVEGDVVHTTQMNKYVESAVGCFRQAKNSEAFEYMIEQLGFEEMVPPAGENAGPADKWYVLEPSNYRIEIKTNFAINQLKVSVVDKNAADENDEDENDEDENGKVIYEFTYEK